jgi:hypothetical protein
VAERIVSAAFESEVALQQTLARLDFVQGDNYAHTFSRREVPVGGCIPDLVLVRFAEPPDAGLWPTRRSFRHAFVVWLLRRHGSRLHPETIAARAFESLARIRPVLDDLLETGALREAESGALALSPLLVRVQAEVVAVEAKLRRWREALDQATAYARFADRVLVAMDATAAPRTVEALAEFRRRGAGLLAVGTRDFEWLVSPRRSTRKPGPEWDDLVSSAGAMRQTLWVRR